jgi:hypothetical protein
VDGKWRVNKEVEVTVHISSFPSLCEYLQFPPEQEGVQE